MEIPTNHHNDIDEATAIIAAQAREILDLQLTICRLKDEMSRIHLDRQITDEARRVGH